MGKNHWVVAKVIAKSSRETARESLVCRGGHWLVPGRVSQNARGHRVFYCTRHVLNDNSMTSPARKGAAVLRSTLGEAVTPVEPLPLLGSKNHGPQLLLLARPHLCHPGQHEQHGVVVSDPLHLGTERI